jgi:hypothetical protein
MMLAAKAARVAPTPQVKDRVGEAAGPVRFPPIPAIREGSVFDPLRPFP